MELVPGATLGQLVRTAGAMDPAQRRPARGGRRRRARPRARPRGRPSRRLARQRDGDTGRRGEDPRLRHRPRGARLGRRALGIGRARDARLRRSRAGGRRRGRPARRRVRAGRRPLRAPDRAASLRGRLDAGGGRPRASRGHPRRSARSGPGCRARSTAWSSDAWPRIRFTRYPTADRLATALCERRGRGGHRAGHDPGPAPTPPRPCRSPAPVRATAKSADRPDRPRSCRPTRRPLARGAQVARPPGSRSRPWRSARSGWPCPRSPGWAAAITPIVKGPKPVPVPSGVVGDRYVRRMALHRGRHRMDTRRAVRRLRDLPAWRVGGRLHPDRPDRRLANHLVPRHRPGRRHRLRVPRAGREGAPRGPLRPPGRADTPLLCLT